MRPAREDLKSDPYSSEKNYKMAKVLFKNITKSFDAKSVLDDFSLEVYDQEFLVLVGPSGCGKSTTLRILAGLEDPTQGEIFIGDKKVNAIDPKDRDIAMVFQNYALYPHYSVFENIAFGLRLRKVSKDEVNRRVHEAAKLLEIESLLQKKPKVLSGGQRQRVALGRAIVRNPKVFLMDEPLSNLDAKLRVAMRAELMNLQKRLKTTTLYVTHDQVEAMTMGDRIVVLHDGKIQQIGKPHEIYHTPSNVFVAGFMGSPPMNFLDKGKLVLGVRPEHISLSGAIKGSSVKTPEPSLEISAQFKMIEPLGAESLVHVTLMDSNTVWVVRCPGIPSFEPNQALTLSIPYSAIHYFDAEQEGLRIEAPSLSEVHSLKKAA